MLWPLNNLGRLYQLRSKSACNFFNFTCATKGIRWLSAGDDKKPSSSESADDDSDKMDEQDEYGMDGFTSVNIEREEKDLEAALKSLQEDDSEVTPELASDLVARMVEATSRSFGEHRSPSLLPFITPHTIHCLQASRISRNTIQAALSDTFMHPIEKKVTAEIHIDSLNLSTPARTALELLSGSRLQDAFVKIGCNRFPSLEENRAHIVTQIDRLVAAARTSVGEHIDTTPLESWDQVREQVQIIASDEIEEAGNLQLLLGETK